MAIRHGVLINRGDHRLRRQPKVTQMELLVFLALGYFLPTIIVCMRKPDAKGNIIALSLLLGWLPMVSIICIIWALCAKTTSKQLDQVNLIAAAMVAAQNGQILNAAPVVPRAPKAQPEVRDWVKALGIVKAQPEPVA
jgi:hypothetical protein